MNGGHDLGGLHGLGPIELEADEPVFHDEWERRAFALTLAIGSRGEWNQDESRFARESMEPGEYLRTSYYEHWLHGLEVLLADRGHLTAGEIEQRMKTIQPDAEIGDSPGHADDRVLPVERVALTMGRGGTARMEDVAPVRFRPGDRVTTINANPKTHTRLPRYARAKTGVVEIDHGTFVYPDTHATERQKVGVRLYAVRFNATDIWGPDDARGDDSLIIDIFDPYLLEASTND